jgi:glyoxylase I family protein
MPIVARNVTPLLQVFDMRKSVAWYCDMLGFEVQQWYEPDGHLYWAMLKLDGAVLMLNAKYEDDQRPAQPPPRADHADVTLYFDCPDVDAAYAHVSDMGLKAAPPSTTHYSMKQLTITDPRRLRALLPAAGCVMRSADVSSRT